MSRKIFLSVLIFLLFTFNIFSDVNLNVSKRSKSNYKRYISGFRIAKSPKYKDFVFYRGDKTKKEVALTFDDGPDPVWTPKVLDVLRKHKIKATFFLIGKKAEKYPDIVKQIHQQGHVIGTHTYSHLNITYCKKPKAIFEIEKTHNIIKKITGEDPYLFRPPYGAYQKRFYNYLKQYNYKIILWTISAEDWNGDSTEKIEARILSGIRPGAILLFHDSGGNRQPTIDALNIIIEKIKNLGYNFITVEEMFFKDNIIAFKK